MLLEKNDTLLFIGDSISDYERKRPIGEGLFNGWGTSYVANAASLICCMYPELGVRIKNVMNICVPLIFSTMDRIDVISNAMDLRAFGKHKKRTWYAKRPLGKIDYICIGVSAVILAAVILIATFINHGRFWNPFV